MNTGTPISFSPTLKADDIYFSTDVNSHTQTGVVNLTVDQQNAEIGGGGVFEIIGNGDTINLTADFKVLEVPNSVTFLGSSITLGSGTAYMVSYFWSGYKMVLNVSEVLTTSPISPTYDFGQALKFDGVDDYCSFPSTSNSVEFSLSVWYNLDLISTSRSNSIFGNDGSTKANLILGVNGSSWEILDAGTSTFTLNTPVQAGVWEHLMLTRNSNNEVRLFHNGVESISGAITNSFKLSDINAIGRRNTNPNFLFRGSMDDFVLKKGVVATSQNAIDLANGVDPNIVFPSAERHYKFNGNGDDSGVDGQDLTLNNFSSNSYVSRFKETWVFILGGQSNATPSTANTGANINEVYPAGTLQWGRYGSDNNKLIPASVPLQNHGLENKQHFGPGFATRFCNKIKEANPNVDIVIIPCAKGGSSLVTDWNSSGGPLYNDMINRVNQCMSENPEFILKGFIWHQGESDRLNTNYQTQFPAFINGWRTDINAANSQTPFVLGGLCIDGMNFYPKLRTLNNYLTTVPSLINYTGFADSESPTVLPAHSPGTGNLYHFGSAESLTLGDRYYNAYLTALGNF